MTEQTLFTDERMFLGGLSNEEDLVRICPKEFRNGNPWSDYAMKLFYFGASTKNWKFKSPDEREQRRQLACFNALLGTFGLPHEDKVAVAGWMLSEMLEEIPEPVP